mmetsp:Transcript_10492/g.24317  ORF Transcript_10492/g.24317 Transcript_10492/m.24317 type:complete len:99 (-) Transcript_10492:3011-3307(-)
MKYNFRPCSWMQAKILKPSWFRGRLLCASFTKICIFFILMYQYLFAPLLANCCRFYPRCSVYTRIAIVKHGLIIGVWLGVKRIMRCHPWGGSGHDPVP